MPNLTVLSGLLATVTSLFGTFFVVYSFLRLNSKMGKFEELADSVGDLFRYEEDEEGKVLLDARVSKMMQAFSSGIAKSMQMSILGKLSGPARLDKGLKGAMAADAAENAMPLLGLVGDIFGINTTKYIKNHPDAMMQLIADPRIQNFIGSVMGGQRNNHPSGQGVM